MFNPFKIYDKYTDRKMIRKMNAARRRRNSSASSIYITQIDPIADIVNDLNININNPT